jgi:hypothetical protein
MPVMELSYLLTHSGLACPEASSKVCHDSFCQSRSSVSLPWIIYYEAFSLHVVSSYDTLALPVLLYGSETWTIKARDARRISAGEMKYRRTAGYTWTDYKTNSQIAKELKITPILDK